MCVIPSSPVGTKIMSCAARQGRLTIEILTVIRFILTNGVPVFIIRFISLKLLVFWFVFHNWLFEIKKKLAEMSSKLLHSVFIFMTSNKLLIQVYEWLSAVVLEVKVKMYTAITKHMEQNLSVYQLTHLFSLLTCKRIISLCLSHRPNHLGTACLALFPSLQSLLNAISYVAVWIYSNKNLSGMLEQMFNIVS